MLGNYRIQNTGPLWSTSFKGVGFQVAVCIASGMLGERAERGMRKRRSLMIASHAVVFRGGGGGWYLWGGK